VETTINSFKEMISYAPCPRARGEAASHTQSQEVPVHAGQHPAPRCRNQGQDPRHPEDARDVGAEPLETTFELNDTLFAKAEVPPTDEVYLWLGANVMLSYSLPDAVELLSSKLSTAKASLITCEEDLEFLREQITVGCVIALGGCLLTGLDARGCICSRVQLGHCAAQERQGGRRLNRGQEGPFAERLGGWLVLPWARSKQHVHAVVKVQYQATRRRIL
jgi:hypothetical protein